MHPKSLPGSLLALALAAYPVSAQDFNSELGLSFALERTSSTRTDVVISGTSIPGFSYRGDTESRGGEAVATRFLAPVTDDGSSPRGLLPYLARSSSISLRAGLSGLSNESTGSSQGLSTGLTSTLSGSGHDAFGGASAAVFLDRSTCLLGSLDLLSRRTTDATNSVELPSGRQDLGLIDQRGTNLSVSLGVRRFFGDHSVALEGLVGRLATDRADRSVFSGGSASASSYEILGVPLGGRLSGRVLAFSRRLALDGAVSFLSTTTDLDDVTNAAAPRRADEGLSSEWSGSLGGTAFLARDLGVTLGAAYVRRDDESGLTVRRKSGRRETVTALAGVRWYASPSTSVALEVAHAEGRAASPPDGPSYQKFRDRETRLALSAGLRF